DGAARDAQPERGEAAGGPGAAASERPGAGDGLGRRERRGKRGPAMIRITVQYAAQARAAAGVSSESVELDGPRPVGEVLSELARRRPELSRFLLAATGRPHLALLLFVGDEQVAPGAGRPLLDGETLCILPPIAGG